MSPVPPDSGDWHRLAPEEAVARLGSDPVAGLSDADAAARLAEAGPNAIVEARRRTLAAMFVGQFADVMILVLLAAAVISGVIGEPEDSVAILVILALNAGMGALQEYRAQRAVSALRRMAAPAASVRRGGSLRTLPSAELVPGDVVLLEAGNRVPADLRLLEAVELQLDESVLTGESQTVGKSEGRLDAPAPPLGDRCNMAFKGTHVTRGRGAGLVVATGMHTEIGRIAGLLAEEESARTPLQRRLATFGRYLALAVLAICAVVFGVGLLQGQPVVLMFLTAVSLAVAAIPEALPAVITVALAIGARKLSGRQSLVRKLPAVETLGSVTTICADKTGTLTENRMTAEAFFVDGEPHERLREAGAGAPWDPLGCGLALGNDVVLRAGEATGDPTELALFACAEAAGFRKAELEQRHPRVAEIAFDDARKRMTTFHRDGAGFTAYTKGAPEAVLPLCGDVLTGSGEAALDRAAVLRAADELAQAGHRVLAVARRRLEDLPQPMEAAEQGLTFLGLVGLIDPPRPEVPGAVAECRSAGIAAVMITGDHPGTASAIAARLGIAAEGEGVITGEDLERLSDAELERRAADVRVYARVTAEQKIRIVKALEARGECVAMTGDGVNDAPALRRAAIGVAMGRKGTDVAREAADLVLLDDNFATIVGAVREGRRIFDNIRNFIKYTMSSNAGEIWTLFLAPFLGLPIPLLPIHILWVNLVTDGLPGLAFTAEPADPEIMRRPPRPPRESIFAHGLWQHVLWVGLLIGCVSIASQAWAWSRGAVYWQTVVFTVLTLSQLFHALAVRSERASLFRIGVAGNLPMLGALLLTLGLQLAVIYHPALQPIFKTQALPLTDLAVCFGLSALVLGAVELEKALARRGRIYAQPAGG